MLAPSLTQIVPSVPTSNRARLLDLAGDSPTMDTITAALRLARLLHLNGV